MALDNTTTKSDDVLDFIIDEFEGGFISHPDDSGGPTKYGVTKKALSGYLNHAVRTNDIHELTKEGAKNVYRAAYVKAVRGDDIEYRPLRLAMVDYAIHSGPRRVIRALQDIVGTACDGLLGPITWKAIQDHDPHSLFVQLMAERMIFLTRIVSNDKSQVSFIKGWGKRLARILEQSV